MKLRFITYLAPSLPARLFELTVAEVGQLLEVETSLEVETRWSGPPDGEPNPFSEGQIDVGWMCSPAYLHLRALSPAPVELLGVGHVPDDPRGGGRPVYFSDVVVRHDHPARSFEDLLDARWAYNDAGSLSGYYCIFQSLAERGLAAHFRGGLRRTGSHLASIAAVRDGEVDAAAIDSCVLGRLTVSDPRLRSDLRVVESWGPYPIQPMVVSSRISFEMRQRLRQAVLDLAGIDAVAAELRTHGLRGWASVTDEDYEAERRALSGAMQLAPAGGGAR